MELSRAVRDLTSRMQFHSASEELMERAEASVLACEIDELYLRWGFVDIEGLTIDGHPVTVELLTAKGPEDLVQEIVAAIKTQCGLTDEERKN